MATPNYGPGLLGSVIGAVLFGMTIVQANTYFHRCQGDRRWIKATVALICALDGAHLCFAIHMMYFYVIANYGNPAAADTVLWSFKGVCISQALVMLIVQVMYIMRIWILSQRTVTNVKLCSLFLVVMAMIGLFAFGTNILYIVGVGQIKSNINNASFHTTSIIGCTVTIFVDIFIAAALSALLYLNKPGVKRTDSVLSAIMQYVIGSGLLTGIANLVDGVLYATLAESLIFLALEFSITRLYVNSFLAMMNARDSFRDKLSVPMDLETQSVSNAMQFEKYAEKTQPIGNMQLSTFLDDCTSLEQPPGLTSKRG